MTEQEEERLAKELLTAFEERSGLKPLRFVIRSLPGGPLLEIKVGNPNERFYAVLRAVLDGLDENHIFREATKLSKTSRNPWLESPEARLLQAELSSILTVDRFSFKEDFFSRYIPSVFGAEEQIEADANHIVFGRRGSGKSSLLVYAMKRLEEKGMPSAWVDMQTYAGRSDAHVCVSVLEDVLRQLTKSVPSEIGESLAADLKSLDTKDVVALADIQRLAPKIRQVLGLVAERYGRATIFLDDMHLLGKDFQPAFLSTIYAICRGNRTYLKISGIEGFMRLWDAGEQQGLELPDDAQSLRLDYNLTIPAKSLKHIQEILNVHALYCGLPSVTVLCSKKALSRLVWLAAGVPRDAINIFTQAMTLAATKGQKSLTITSLNSAASAAAEDKMRFVAKDSSDAQAAALTVLERVKAFCIRDQRKNAFLVEIVNEHPTYEALRNLIDLRLLHVLNPGITPGAAGQRFVALLLDYGFYTGMRAAKSVDLFQKEATTPTVKELRKLPRFKLD